MAIPVSSTASFKGLGDVLGQYKRALWAIALKTGGMKNIGMQYINLQVAV